MDWTRSINWIAQSTSLQDFSRQHEWKCAGCDYERPCLSFSKRGSLAEWPIPRSKRSSDPLAGLHSFRLGRLLGIPKRFVIERCHVQASNSFSVETRRFPRAILQLSIYRTALTTNESSGNPRYRCDDRNAESPIMFPARRIITK